MIMPTKPLHIAFWSLLIGFVSVMALALPRIDTRPMAIIAGRESSLPSSSESHRRSSNELDRSEENDRDDSQFVHAAPPRSMQNMMPVSMPGSSTQVQHEPSDDEAEPRKKDSDALIEIGTIVIPSLTAQRNAAERGRSAGDAALNVQLIEVEKRLDQLQKRLDHLLASQVQHQTAELEAITSLVDQMQNDRKILKLKQQLQDLQDERQHLTSTTRDGDAKRTDDGETDSTDGQSNHLPAPTFSAPSPGSSDGWNSASKAKITTDQPPADQPQSEEKPRADAAENSSAEKRAADHPATSLKVEKPSSETKSQPAKSQSPSTEPKPTDKKPVQRSPKIAERNPKVTERKSTAPEKASTDDKPAVPADTPAPHPTSSHDHSPANAPLVPPADELTIPVPPADELDVVPFDTNTSDLPEFKLPGKSGGLHKIRQSKQPHAAGEVVIDEFKLPIEADRSSAKIPPPPENGSRAKSKTSVPPATDRRADDEAPSGPAKPAGEPNYLFPPESKSGSSTLRKIDSSSSQVSDRHVAPPAPGLHVIKKSAEPILATPVDASAVKKYSSRRQASQAGDRRDTTVAPRELATAHRVEDDNLRGELYLEMRIFSVRLKKGESKGVDWGRIQMQDGRPLVDFAPTSNPSKRGSDLALGILHGEVQGLQSQLQRTNYVEILSQESHTLHDQQESRIPVGAARAGIFETEELEKWAPPAPGSAAERVPHHPENGYLIVRPQSVGENQVRLDLKVSEMSNAEQSSGASVVLKPGETLVWGGMIFEETSIDQPVTSTFGKLPLLGRFKAEKPRTAGVRSERVVLLTIRRRDDTSHQQTSLTVENQRAKKTLAAPTAQQRKLSGREYELAIQLYQQDSPGPALRHAKIALELNPDNRLARQLVDQITATQSSLR